MSPLAWSALLMVLAITLIFLELFIPSGGLLSLMAAVLVSATPDEPSEEPQPNEETPTEVPTWDDFAPEDTDF